MHSKTLFRALYYTLGMLILALGLTLNTKTGLGVSPIISLPYCVSEVFSLNFGNTTLVAYCVFVAIQFALRGKNARLYDLLQIPLSLVFTRVLNLYSVVFDVHFAHLWQNLLLLAVAIVCTGVGAAMTLDMKLVPNPGDGIVQALAEFFHRETGLTKNLFDLLNVTLTFLLGLATGRFLCGIGIGTLLGVLGVGRVIAVFNKLCKETIVRQAGIA
ncbi:MAG: DUF6198 family protein [Clostridia bacterium]|nr:DUF6198 family protein [Clostridia bacterium]